MQASRSTFQASGQRVGRLADALHAVMGRYGYELVETPIIQAAELFLTKAGDQILTRLFTFERRNQPLALRPEFTAVAAYYYVTERARSQQPVVRWQFGGPIFEDDPSHSGVHYQRFSIGAELIGMGGALADAEIIAMALGGLAELGMRNCQLVIGHVGLMRLLLSRFNLDPRTQRFLLNHLPALKDPSLGKAHVLERLDRMVLGRGSADTDEPFADDGSVSEFNTQQMLDALLDATQRNVTMGGRTRHDIVRRLLQKRQRASERQQVVAALDFLEAWGGISALPDEALAVVRRFIAPDDVKANAEFDELKRVVALLSEYGIAPDRIRIQPDLARSWDYYTGIVFEIYAGSGVHAAGGGRYDELVRLVGGQHDVPAVGFVYYPEQILTALPYPAAAGESAVVLLAGDAQQAAGIRWAEALRASGMSVILNPASGTPAEAGATLVVQPDGSLHFAGAGYHISQLDMLIADLKRA